MAELSADVRAGGVGGDGGVEERLDGGGGEVEGGAEGGAVEEEDVEGFGGGEGAGEAG